MKIYNKWGELIFDGDDLSAVVLKNAYLVNADLNNPDQQHFGLKCSYPGVVDLRGTNLQEANMRKANLKFLDMRGANISEAILIESNLFKTNLEKANLKKSNLFGSVMSLCNLRSANLRGANLRNVSLRSANLEKADLRGADITYADLTNSNLWRAKGLPTWNENFTTDDDGYIIAYKERKNSSTICSPYHPDWVFEEDNVLTEREIDRDPRILSGKGISFGRFDWVMQECANSLEVWEIRVDPENIVFPYASDGRARAGKVRLIRKIEEDVK